MAETVGAAADPGVADRLALAADFPAVTRADWTQLAAGVLRRTGAADDVDPFAALTRTSDSGLPVAPIYFADDVPADLRDGGMPAIGGGDWDVRQRHAEPDAARANAAVLADLELGATSLWLTIGPGAIAAADLARVLSGVYLDLAPIVLDAGAATHDAAEAFLALPGADQASGNLGADPIGVAVRRGGDATLDGLAALADRTHEGLRAITVDATAFHDAGATDADCLALATASGVAYLRALTDAGRPVEAALDQIEFRLAVTDDQFGSIALLRAARRLWARVGELCGVVDAEQRQHAVTSRAMMTRRDPWTNLLRTTVACFAAAVGGAQAITVAPYDAAIGHPVDLARRLARNTQAVLHDEASLGRVADPAGGSWFVEAATDQLATAAWESFTTIERHGGIVGLLPQLPERFERAKADRAQRYAHRDPAITGVSEFPDLDEPAVTRDDPAPDGYRYAEPFEAQRDRSDAILAATGTRPTVVLAALGKPSAYSARAGFARNLFAAGGLASDLRTEVGDVAGRVVCLVSADKIYDEQAGEVVGELRVAGAARVLLAGAARPDLDVDDYVFTGCDALAALSGIWQVVV